jgi:hypothetical protein
LREIFQFVSIGSLLSIVRRQPDDGESIRGCYSRSASVICHLSFVICHALRLPIAYSPEEQVGQQFLSWINGITAEIGHPDFSQNIFIDTEMSGKAPRLTG